MNKINLYVLVLFLLVSCAHQNKFPDISINHQLDKNDKEIKIDINENKNLTNKVEFKDSIFVRINGEENKLFLCLPLLMSRLNIPKDANFFIVGPAMEYVDIFLDEKSNSEYFWNLFKEVNKNLDYKKVKKNLTKKLKFNHYFISVSTSKYKYLDNEIIFDDELKFDIEIKFEENKIVILNNSKGRYNYKWSYENNLKLIPSFCEQLLKE